MAPFQKQSPVPFKGWAPVYVTLAEREEYQSAAKKTVPEIKDFILAKLGNILDLEMKNAFLEIWDIEFVRRRGKKPLKQEYLDFLFEVENYIDIESVMEVDVINTEDLETAVQRELSDSY